MIQQINKNDKYWQSCIMHLKEAKMLEHINLESPEYLYIVKIVENEVIGHITLIKKILDQISEKSIIFILLLKNMKD